MALIRLGRCPSWSESLLGAQVILLVLSWCISYMSCFLLSRTELFHLICVGEFCYVNPWTDVLKVCFISVINLFASALLCGENCSCPTSGYTMEESQQVSCLVYNNVYCFIHYLVIYYSSSSELLSNKSQCGVRCDFLFNSSPLQLFYFSCNILKCLKTNNLLQILPNFPTSHE